MINSFVPPTVSRANSFSEIPLPKLRKVTSADKILPEPDLSLREHFEQCINEPKLNDIFLFLFNIDTPKYEDPNRKTRRISILHFAKFDKPTESPAQLFLKHMNQFFHLEHNFWKCINKDNKKLKKSRKRNWPRIFNVYAEDSNEATFNNILASEKLAKYEANLSSFIELEKARSNAENSISSDRMLQVAEELLEFFHTHHEDCYSCTIGQLANTQITKHCITNCQTFNEGISFDLSKYLIEVSLIKNELDVARNVRVLSAKLRGIYSHVNKGSIVLLVLPTEESETPFPNKKISTTNLYELSRQIFPTIITNQFTQSLLQPNQTTIKAIFARCASKPTADNLIGLYVTPSESTIVWTHTYNVYLVKPEFQVTLRITDFVSCESEIQKHFFYGYENELYMYISEKCNVSLTTLHTLIVSPGAFIDEDLLLRIVSLLDELQLNCSVIMNNASEELEKVKKFYTQNYDRLLLFSPKRKLILDSTSTSKNSEVAESVISKLRSKIKNKLETLESNRQKILKGTKKKGVTTWWLKEIRRAVLQFLRNLGYRYEAIPKDYTNVPPSNLSIVKMNGDLLDEVLNETSEYHEQLKDLIEQLKEKIYPKIRSLVNDFIAVLLREAKIPVTLENIKSFKLDSWREHVSTLESSSDILSKVGETIKDVEYIMLMFLIENNPEERTHHPHIIPVSGLVISSIVRLSSECRTVLELWKPKYQISDSANKNIIKKLEKHGITDPNSMHNTNILQTHLHFYCSPSGDFKIVLKLLQYDKIELNPKDINDNTPLHVLCSLPHSEKSKAIRKQLTVCRKLLSLNADISAKNSLEETPLFNAIDQNNIELVRLLLTFKSDPSIQNCTGENCLARCQRKFPQNSAMIDLLAKDSHFHHIAESKEALYHSVSLRLIGCGEDESSGEEDAN